MTSPHEPSGENGPQQWGQQPQPGGYPGTPAGGVPAAPQPGQPQQWGPQPQPGQPQWGQQPGYPPGGQYGQAPGYGEPPASGKKSSSVVVTVVIIVLVVLIAVVAFLAFVTPGFLTRKVFSNSDVQNGVTDVLKNDYKLNVGTVTCPPDQPVKVGSTFTCKAVVDGQTKSVQITVKADDGHYEVGQPQ